VRAILSLEDHNARESVPAETKASATGAGSGTIAAEPAAGAAGRKMNCSGRPVGDVVAFQKSPSHSEAATGLFRWRKKKS
jgi:hypothetical protein